MSMNESFFVCLFVLQDNGKHGNNIFLGSPIHKASMQMNPVSLPWHTEITRPRLRAFILPCQHSEISHSLLEY